MNKGINNEMQIGDEMPDGTRYAGISPDTGRPMYTTPADAPGVMYWKEAMTYARKFKGQGHKDWRVPTVDELNALFNAHAAIGGFRGGPHSGFQPNGWYWSSSVGEHGYVRVQRYGDWQSGTMVPSSPCSVCSMRLVRG